MFYLVNPEKNQVSTTTCDIEILDDRNRAQTKISAEMRHTTEREWETGVPSYGGPI